MGLRPSNSDEDSEEDKEEDEHEEDGEFVCVELRGFRRGGPFR